MSNTRALVSCTILSLQDSCFIYPCCKGCLSRLIQENKRATCVRCGFTCDLQNVDYRYRLSFKVSRNQDIFGVTVFGGCLNPFFGITAGCLQRFIDSEKTDGTHTVQQLLVKAVEDCFIGRCVVFGLKVPHNNSKTSSLSGQLVACQIISPCESLMGCTVIAYFKNLLQANSDLCCSESAKDMCPSQQIDSQSSQRDELNRFDYTPPSCARLDSQPSSEGFTISSPWQSPGLCFPPEESSNHLSRDCDRNIFSPKKEETSTCKCTRQSNSSQLKHVHCITDELKNETNNEKSFSSSCDMFESSAHLNGSTACDTMNPLRNFSCENNSEITTSGHCLVRAKPGDDYDSSFHEKLLDSLSGQNICFDLEDAPLSESLHDFVRVEPQISKINDTKECSSGKRDDMIQVQNRCCISKTKQMPLCGDELSSPMRNVNNIRWKKNDENECPENLEIKMNIAKIPKTPTVLCTANSSGLKNMTPLSPDIMCAFNHPTNNGLSFSNKKRTLKRKKFTKSRPSATFCSVNHEESKYFRHCAQSEVHSVNCKVKQELIVFDDHGEKYNCSVDLFASGQCSMDMNISDVTEIYKVNEPRNVNTSEPGVSGSLLFSPCLQSTPVSYHQHSCVQKTGRALRSVSSVCSRATHCEIQSKITDLGLSDKRLNFDQLLTVGSEGFSGETDKQDASCNLSVNEWSRDLFENSF